MLGEKLYMAYNDMEDVFGEDARHLHVPFKDVDDRAKRLQHWGQIITDAEAMYLPQDIDGQVEYFKNLKPAFTQMLLYYSRVYHYELNEPPRSKKYYTKALKAHEKEYYKIQDWFIYVKSEDTSKDQSYFQAGSDKREMVGMVHAGNMITAYLLTKLGLAKVDTTAEIPISRVQWHFSQNDIAEMAKGFKVSGLATGSLQDIAEELGSVFNVKINNLYIKLHVISHRQNVAQLFDKCSKNLKKSNQ